MATEASEELAVRVCDGTISAARKRTGSVHYRTIARAVERKDMAPHQTFYLKADRLLLNPHESADWVTSIEKATVFGSESEAQTLKGQRKDASGVIKDKDERYFYVMRVER
jgi:hypothetical protein